MRNLLALTLAATLAASVACHRQSQTATPAAEQAPATVSVTNQRFYDMDIFVSGTGGGRIRLGLATGNSTKRFTIPAYVVANGGMLRFTADPIGPSGVSRSEELRVFPGDVVSLTITP